MSDSSTDAGTRSPLSSITRGASLHFFGRLLSTGLRFVLNLVLTRSLGPALFGIYAYTRTLMSFIVIVARFGTGKSLLRFIPKYEEDPERRNRTVGLAYLTAVAGSAFLGGSLYFAAPLVSSLTLKSALLVTTLRVFAIVLPFNAVMKLTHAVFRGLELLEYQVLVENVAYPVVQLGVVVAAVALGYSLLGVVAALAVGLVLVSFLCLALLYTRTSVRPQASVSSSRMELSEFYSYSIPLTMKDLGSLLYNRVDILMIGFFLAETAVGVYRISVLVATILALPLGAFNQLFPPVASRLYMNDEMDELEQVYETITRWALTVTIPPALVMILYSAELLRVFGAEFTVGGLVLTLFAVAQLTDSAVGPSGFLLLMTDHQYLNMTNQWLLGVLNVVFNYVLIQELGLIGAAVVSAGVLTLINVLRVVEVWYTEGLVPYSTSFWKPVGAGLGAGLVMASLSRVLDGYALLVGGSLVGGCVFVSLLLAFGIEQHDLDFFADLVGEGSS